MDVVVRPDVAVERGTDVPGSVRFRVGGSAANTARVFALLGGRASFVGAVGSDSLGRRLTAFLRREGVAVHAVRVRGSSARLLALIDPVTGERSFVTERGAADGLSVGALRQAWLARVDGLHVPAYSLLNPPLSEAAFAAIELARARGAVVSVDLASRGPLMAAGRRAAVGLIKRAAPDVLFANSDEASALVGSLEPRVLARLAPVIVVKLGAAGCQVIRAGGSGPGSGNGAATRSVVAARPVTAADTTGAGDAFAAGFLYSLIASGYGSGAVVSDAVLRRAALAGHSAAARLLTGPRKELDFS